WKDVGRRKIGLKIWIGVRWVSKIDKVQTSCFFALMQIRSLMAKSPGFVSAGRRSLVSFISLSRHGQGACSFQRRARGGQPLFVVDRPELEIDGGRIEAAALRFLFGIWLGEIDF